MHRNFKKQALRFGRIIFYLLRWSSFTCSLLVLLALLYLFTAGLPDEAVGAVARRLQEAGLPVQIENIRLSPGRGWAIRHVKLYSASPDHLQPLLAARKMYVWIWPENWKHPAKGRWQISIHARESALSLGPEWDAGLGALHPLRNIQKLHADFAMHRDLITLYQAEALWGDIQFRAHGIFNLCKPPAGAEPRDIAAIPPGAIQSSAIRLAELLENLSFQEPPEVSLDFKIHPDNPALTWLGADLHAKNPVWKQLPFDAFDATGYFGNGHAELTTFRLTQGKKGLNAVGRFDPAKNKIEAAAANSLSAEALLHLLPDRWQSTLDRQQLEVAGALDFELHLGPAPKEAPFSRFTLKADSARFRYKAFELENLHVEAEGRDNKLFFSNITATVTGNPEQTGGALAANAVFNTKTLDYDLHLTGGCEPALLTPLTPPATDEILRLFDITDVPPDVDLRIVCGARKGAPLFMTGTVSGKNLHYRGTFLDDLQAGLIFTNNTLRLAPLRCGRDGRYADGTLLLNFKTKTAEVSAVSTLNPKIIAQIIQPGAKSPLDLFTFSGPVRTEAEGRVDWGRNENHNLTGTLKAERIGTQFGPVDRADARVRVRGSQLIFDSIAMNLHAGRGEASGTFDLKTTDGTAPYQLNLELNRLDLQNLMEGLSGKEQPKASGRFSASMEIHADASREFWETARGNGSAEIEKGRLANVPLFGGFTSLIRTAFPTFSLFSLTDLFADYEIRAGGIYSDNVQLSGSVMSLRALGNYTPEDGLDFTAQVEPLRQPPNDPEAQRRWYEIWQWTKEAVRWSTSPFFKFFEFKLEGSLENPEWRFINLPKEISSPLQNPPGRKSGNEN